MKMNGQITDVDHLCLGALLFNTEAPRKPGSQQNVSMEKVQALGLGEAD